MQIDSGAFIKGIEYASSTESIVVGKPEKDFFNSLIIDEKLENLFTNSNSTRLKVIKKTIRDGSVILDLQQTSTISAVRKVRKYIFLVGQRITIITIAPVF